MPIFFSCLITFLKKWSVSSKPKTPMVFISNMHLKQWNNPHYDHSTSVSFMSKECLTWHLKGRLFCIVWFEKKGNMHYANCCLILSYTSYRKILYTNWKKCHYSFNVWFSAFYLVKLHHFHRLFSTKINFTNFCRFQSY